MSNIRSALKESSKNMAIALQALDVDVQLMILDVVRRAECLSLFIF